jgi:sugar lactone lactonase YvrE
LSVACLVIVARLAEPAPPARAYPHIDNTEGYKADPSWPKEKPPGGEWGGMSSVALGPDGNVWTFNRGRIPVQVYTQDGRLVSYWGQGSLFENPHTIRFDNSGNLWIVDTKMQTVRKFTSDGKVLMTVGTPNEAGEDETHMNQPNDVAIAPNGDIYVSDGYGNNRIVVFDHNGKFIRAWGKLGAGQGEFSQPHGVVLDSKQRVYVADRNNARIQIFDSKGKFLTEWKNIITPWALLMTGSDELYVCGSSPTLFAEVPAGQPGGGLASPPKDQLFIKLDTDGRLKQLWVFPKGDQPGELDWAHSMAVAPDGSLYFAEVKAKRAQKFVPAGSLAKEH